MASGDDEIFFFRRTGRQPDENWMGLRHDRPIWMEKESRYTADSGRETMEGQFASLPSRAGGRKRHADDDTPRRAYADIQKGAGNAQWNGPHKRILFELEDQGSAVSGSETQEDGPGWPPDEGCADSTRYKGSFDDRDREGLRLLSPSFQEKVLKLQKDLAEAKAESRRFRARQAGCYCEPTEVYIDTRATL